MSETPGAATGIVVSEAPAVIVFTVRCSAETSDPRWCVNTEPGGLATRFRRDRKAGDCW